MKQHQACVLFSGGADSTLAAALILKKYSTVHLLSYKHHHMSQMEKTTVAAEKLIRQFDSKTIYHQWIDMTSFWKKLCKIPPVKSLSSQGVFAFLLKPCLACKAAMHLLTSSYCRQHNITVVADGAHPGGARLFPEQLHEGIQILRNFYKNQDIDYQNPVYEIRRPDFELYDQGISEKKNTKDEHIYYSNQFACHVGLMAYGYHYLSMPFDKNKTWTVSKSMDYLRYCLTEEWIPGNSIDTSELDNLNNMSVSG